jgi:hypothetical protein
MPGELREKIKPWEVLNRILKNNGYIDSDAIIADINALKVKLNTLLSEVLGVEHEIDGIHNYDDASLKTQIANISTETTAKIAAIQTLVEAIQADTNALVTRLNGITITSSKISLDNPQQIKISTMVTGYDNVGTYLNMYPNSVQLRTFDTASAQNLQTDSSIRIGGPSTDDGIVIGSDRPILLTNALLDHSIQITNNGNEISDLNGLTIELDGTTGVVIRNLAQTKVAHIPWELT